MARRRISASSSGSMDASHELRGVRMEDHRLVRVGVAGRLPGRGPQSPRFEIVQVRPGAVRIPGRVGPPAGEIQSRPTGASAAGVAEEDGVTAVGENVHQGRARSRGDLARDDGQRLRRRPPLGGPCVALLVPQRRHADGGLVQEDLGALDPDVGMEAVDEPRPVEDRAEPE
jgi:hypothetical protein